MNSGETCDKCGWFGNKTDPQTGLALLEETKHGLLCSVCRTDIRLENGYYEE